MGSTPYGTGRARSAFIDKVVNTRNYYTHYDEGIQDQAATDARELLQLYHKLDNLLMLHLLKLSGMEDSLITKAATLRESLYIELKGACVNCCGNYLQVV